MTQPTDTDIIAELERHFHFQKVAQLPWWEFLPKYITVSNENKTNQSSWIGTLSDGRRVFYDGRSITLRVSE